MSYPKEFVVHGYHEPEIDWVRLQKSAAIPDQSMTIKEIVERFVRGIPVDVLQREAVYVNQTEFDLEALSRMDFGDKASLSEELRVRSEGLESRLGEIERTKRESEQKAYNEAVQRASKSGIVPLDNTMPVDTSKTVK